MYICSFPLQVLDPERSKLASCSTENPSSLIDLPVIMLSRFPKNPALTVELNSVNMIKNDNMCLSFITVPPFRIGLVL